MRLIAIITSLVACLSPVTPSAAGERTHEFTLDNGLELIVQEDHRAPVAAILVWYRVGSSYEYDGITGVSHALEHMMFKGTRDLGVGEFSAIVAANGGRENAFTGSDYTAYFQLWSAENVGLSFKLEADRMQNLLIDDAEFAKENQCRARRASAANGRQPTGPCNGGSARHGIPDQPLPLPYHWLGGGYPQYDRGRFTPVVRLLVWSQ